MSRARYSWLALVLVLLAPISLCAQTDSARAPHVAPAPQELQETSRGTQSPLSVPNPPSDQAPATISRDTQTNSASNSNASQSNSPAVNTGASPVSSPATANTAFGYIDFNPKPVMYPMAFTPYDVNSIGFSFLQSASGNWLYGEQNFFNIRISGSSVGDMETGNWVLKRTINGNLGARYSQDSSEFEPLRVSDNEFFAEGVLFYKAGWSINPYVSTSLRTPITESFRYTTSTRWRTANFWDPVTTMQSVGFNYISYKGFDYYSARAGVALYQTRARSNFTLTDNWNTPEIEYYKAESGIESVSEANVSIDSSIFIRGRLELFGSFKRLDIWMLNSRNEVRFKVWKWVNAIFACDIIHDIRWSRRTQWRQSLMIGVTKDF